MTLIELMTAYGDVEFQKLDDVVLKLARTKGGTKVTFATDVDFDINGLKQAGMIVWFDRDKAQQIMKARRDQ